MYTAHDDWDGDPHRWDSQVHYRLYVGRDGQPAVICAQDFDYFDYDARRMLSPEAWPLEAQAEQALVELLPSLAAAGRQASAALGEHMTGLRARLIAQMVRDSQTREG